MKKIYIFYFYNTNKWRLDKIQSSKAKNKTKHYLLASKLFCNSLYLTKGQHIRYIHLHMCVWISMYNVDITGMKNSGIKSTRVIDLADSFLCRGGRIYNRHGLRFRSHNENKRFRDLLKKQSIYRNEKYAIDSAWINNLDFLILRIIETHTRKLISRSK